MLNFHHLKAQVNQASGHEQLRMDGQGDIQLRKGSFLGRQVQRLFPQAHPKAQEAVAQAMQGEYGAEVTQATKPLIKSNQPLTAKDIKKWIESAQKLQIENQMLSSSLSDEDNFALKSQFVELLSQSISDAAMNQALKVVDMSPETRWEAMDMHRLCMTAQALESTPTSAPTTSNRANAYFGDANKTGETQYLGAGTTNTVLSAKWVHQSEKMEKVFKPLPTQAPESFGAHGINAQGDGNLLGRNVASSEVAHALGMPGKITASQFGQLNGVQGIVMDKAQGESIATESLSFKVGIKSTEALKKEALNYALQYQNLEIASSDDKKITLRVKNAELLRKKVMAEIQSQLDAWNQGLPDEEQLTLTSSGKITAGPKADQLNLEIMQDSLQGKMASALTITVLPLDAQGNISNATLNLELNQMQWLDFICGQADRNPGNIFIQYGTYGEITGITGIDQDLSFGEKVDATFRGGTFQGMPKHIDGVTAEKIQTLYKDRENFEHMLRNNGLSNTEVEQTLARLKDAHAAIQRWENQSASITTEGILPAASAQWSKINTNGYSEYFANSAKSSQATISFSALQALLNTADEPELIKFKADLHAQQHIGKSLESICGKCKTEAGRALAHSALQQLTPQELAIVMAQASAQQITTLAVFANAHPAAVHELKKRYQSDTQRFHATVQHLQVKSLNSSGTLSNAPNAPAFAHTTVQLAETWAALQTYAQHPSTPIPLQTQAEHLFLQGYLQAQTQPNMLNANDLGDEQLGKLNLALKKLVPSQQRDTVLQSFTSIFTQAFESRLTAQSECATDTWGKLLATPFDKGVMQETLDTLRTLSQQRELVIERAAAMLMDGARNDLRVQEILQNTLQNALQKLPYADAQIHAQNWMQEHISDTLEANMSLLLEMSDEEEAFLSHFMASLPALVRKASTAS